MDDAEEDVLAYMTFPKEHRAKLHSTNPIARLNGEIKRRTEVELPPKDRTCSGLRLRADELARRLIS